MDLNSKRMTGAPVFTRSGRMLGKLASIDVDADTGHLASIRVSSGLVKGLLAKELVITWGEVIEMHEEKIIVADASVPIGATMAALA